jgi:hypothetical protein
MVKPFPRVMKQVMINFALCMTSVLVAIGGAELALRYTTYGVPPQGAPFFPRYYHRADPISGHDITPNFPATELRFRDYFVTFGSYYTVASNELGCRDERVKGEEPYILLVGDSFAWAQVPFEHAFGTVIQNLIGVRVMKCGVSGYGTRHELHKLEQVVNQVGHPRTIIVAYFIENDLTDDYLYPGKTVLDGYLLSRANVPDSQTNGQRTRTDEELREELQRYLEHHEETFVFNVKSFMTKHSRVYTLLRNTRSLRQVAFTFGLADPPPPSHYEAAPIFHPLDDFVWLRQAWQLHMDNLRELKQAAESHNARLLLVIIPTKEQVYEYLRPSAEGIDWEYPNRRLKEFFEKEEISFLDLLPELKTYASTQPKVELDRREDLYWPHDSHLNIKGNRLTALLIGRHMLEQSFVDVFDKSGQLSDINQSLSGIGNP